MIGDKDDAGEFTRGTPSWIEIHARHTPEDEALGVAGRAFGDSARVTGGDRQSKKSWRQGIHVVVSTRVLLILNSYELVSFTFRYTFGAVAFPSFVFDNYVNHLCLSLVNTLRRKTFYRIH